MKLLYLTLVILLSACGSSGTVPETPPVEKEITWQVSPASLSFAAQTDTKNVLITANGDWTVASSQAWCTTDRTQGFNGQTSLKVTVATNPAETERNAELTLTSGKYSAKIPVSQEGVKIEDHVPDGYTLKWQDEFNDARLSGGKTPMPNADKWYFETGGNGWGNNEIQNYIPGYRGTDTCAVISDGTLKIIAKKVGTEVLSIRMNTKESWQYGYFEARLRMPSGKGTWPAFWMLPKDFNNWPLDGEIDIMEYVGYDPNVVHSTVHTQAYNHGIGTQKGKSIRIPNAETEFNVYAVEWTADYIKGFANGVEYFRFDNDGNDDINTWPFDKPFYLKLNLAWGGNWGGAQGVDETKLPATYEIDYVRVYQK
ncbi:MAG: family 16 glycosylhydrolase [Bacteroidia bacterium]|nr:family 16 glycosylhydrolase [Bacteroidia bacterium]